MSKNNSVSTTWFCVLNNPSENGFPDMEPKETLETIMNSWIKDNPARSCALTYCISKEGLPHIHGVFQNDKPMRFSKVKECLPKAHIQEMKGLKKDALDYINKVGKYEETGESVLCSVEHGEIKSVQGQRSDLEKIADCLEIGMNPKEIFELEFGYRKYEKMVRDAYYARRISETPIFRDVKTYWHVGESGSGKSYSRVELSERYGRDNIYAMTDYAGGGLDKYYGEPILFMDEFRGQIAFNILLTMLDGYLNQFHARYSNVYGLWTEVHITSVLPPERIYIQMVEMDRELDSYDQLKRRISSIIYHWVEDGEYRSFEMSMDDYIDYQVLKDFSRGTTHANAF